MSKRPGKRWTLDETRAFLHFYKARKHELKIQRKKRMAYANILEDMISAGFDPNIEIGHLEVKMATLLRAYKTAKDNAKCTDAFTRPPLFMDEMEEIFGDKATHSESEEFDVKVKAKYTYDSPRPPPVMDEVEEIFGDNPIHSESYAYNAKDNARCTAASPCPPPINVEVEEIFDDDPIYSGSEVYNAKDNAIGTGATPCPPPFRDEIEEIIDDSPIHPPVKNEVEEIFVHDHIHSERKASPAAAGGQFTTTFEEKLIGLVKKDTSLYMPSKGQANLLKRNSRWSAIGRELNRPANECKQRWRSLRDRYVREKRKMMYLETEGTETDKWYLYDSLEFLNQTVRFRDKRNVEFPSGEIDDSVDIDMDATSSTQDSSSPMEEVFVKFLKDVSATITANAEEPPPEPVTYNQKFMSIMAMRMEPLSEAAKIRIHTIILNSIHEELLKKIKS